MTREREAIISSIAAEIMALPSSKRRRVAIDGVDGAGKTVFADELAAALGGLGAPPIRVSVDGFHYPADVRYRRGRASPEGFFLDSYDYEQLIARVLSPLSPGGSGTYVRAIYDVVRERSVDPVEAYAPEDAVLVIDGIFLHRDELVGFWDYSVWLDVPFEISIPRGAQRHTGLGHPDPAHASNRRYVEGQRLYMRTCTPMRRATTVIDNSVLEAPVRRSNHELRHE